MFKNSDNLLLVNISNGEKERLNIEAEKLIFFKNNFAKLDFIDVNKQVIKESGDSHQFSTVMLNILLLIFFSFKYRVYLKFSFLLNFVQLIKDTLIALYRIFYYKKYYNKINKEKNLSLKHLYAWQYLAYSNFDYAFITENDLNISNSKAFKSSLDNLPDSNSYLHFIVFGHSCRIKDLMVDKLILRQTENLIFFNGIITNGCSGYLISKELSLRLLQCYKTSRIYKYIPIDFSMVILFLRNKKLFKDTETVFIQDSEIIHESSNSLKSTIQF